jgi:hypothetical protein
MIPHHIDYLLTAMGCLWLCIMLHVGWPSRSPGSHPKPVAPVRQHQGQRPRLPPRGFTN